MGWLQPESAVMGYAQTTDLDVLKHPHPKTPLSFSAPLKQGPNAKQPSERDGEENYPRLLHRVSKFL